jgi:lipopolysaccharide heptosyltransferase II
VTEVVYNKNATDPMSILVILPTWLGDFVMATPALRAIRERFRFAKITFLMEPNLRELVRGGDWMDECVELPPKGKRSVFHAPYRSMVKQLRMGGVEDGSENDSTGGRGRFDLAVLFPNSMRSAMIAFLAGAKWRVGYDRDARGLLLTDAVPVRHQRNGRVTVTNLLRDDCKIPVGLVPEPSRLPVKPEKYIPIPIVEYYADLVEAIGCERPGDQLELFTTPDCDASLETRLREIGIADKRPLVVISPGAKFGASKCWPPERFAAVMDRLIESQDAAVIVTCGPGEQGIAASIGLAMRRSGHIFDAPLLSLGELKSLIHRCDLLICNDAGPRHFAKAFGTPVVTVFGPTHPDWTATTHTLEQIVRVNVDCGPCQQKTCPLGHLECMTGVSVDTVYDAAAEMLTSKHG